MKNVAWMKQPIDISLLGVENMYFPPRLSFVGMAQSGFEDVTVWKSVYHVM